MHTTLPALVHGHRSYPFPSDGAIFAIGSSDGCQVQIKDELVEPVHALGRVRGGHLWIRDVGAPGGTVVDGKEVKGDRWTPLKLKSHLQLGKYSLHLGMAAATGAAPPPVAVVVSQAAPITFEQLKTEASQRQLQPKAALEASIARATRAMAKTTGIVELPKGVPTLVITDIHARRDYLVAALDQRTPQGERYFDLLAQGRLNVICIGDGMHAEGRAKERWEAADQAAAPHIARDGHEGEPALTLMGPEMTESLGAMKMVADLKASFPHNFHFIRGNHEDLLGIHFFKFAKKVGESTLVRDWMQEKLGPDFVQRYAQFEAQMPLMAKGTGFVATHSAPGSALTREEIESRSDDARLALNWTTNTGELAGDGHYNWETQDNRHIFEGDLAAVGAQGSHWLIGHKPIHADEHGGLYRTQFNGELVQLNNPDRFVVAEIPADGHFDPDKGIHFLKNDGGPEAGR